MTTKIIDGAISGSSFPTTYTGVGTLAANCINDGGVGNHLTGNFTSTGDAVQINLGFQPRVMYVINDTDGIEYEKLVGQAAANCIKIVLGGSFAGTLDTSSLITFNQANVGEGIWTVTLSSTLVGTAKNIVFSIEG